MQEAHAESLADLRSLQSSRALDKRKAVPFRSTHSKHLLAGTIADCRLSVQRLKSIVRSAGTDMYALFEEALASLSTGRQLRPLASPSTVTAPVRSSQDSSEPSFTVDSTQLQLRSFAVVGSMDGPGGSSVPPKWVRTDVSSALDGVPADTLLPSTGSHGRPCLFDKVFGPPASLRLCVERILSAERLLQRLLTGSKAAVLLAGHHAEGARLL